MTTFVNVALPLIKKYAGHHEEKEAMQLKGNELFPMWSELQNYAFLCLELILYKTRKFDLVFSMHYCSKEVECLIDTLDYLAC